MSTVLLFIYHISCGYDEESIMGFRLADDYQFAIVIQGGEKYVYGRRGTIQPKGDC